MSLHMDDEQRRLAGIRPLRMSLEEAREASLDEAAKTPSRRIDMSELADRLDLNVWHAVEAVEDLIGNLKDEIKQGTPPKKKKLSKRELRMREDPRWAQHHPEDEYFNDATLKQLHECLAALTGMEKELKTQYKTSSALVRKAKKLAHQR
jgi:hypothetical protein